MPHSFVPLKFNPKLTAYWLPPSGQLAAAKIHVASFWALRTNWSGDESDKAPGFIFVVSSDPSPFPLENASLTLGPKFDRNTGACWNDATALRTTKPIRTFKEEHMPLPLYLHTVPMLSLSPYACHPMKTVRYQLDKPSLDKFLHFAHELQDAGWAFRKWHARRHGRTGGSEQAQEDWSTFGEGGRYILGGRNDPKAYVFKFLEGPLYPSFEGPGNIYHEIWQYKQFVLTVTFLRTALELTPLF
uniref:N/A n=1 Tax=Ganoderma boninense TaxID=34458 RepID=A0A5K1JUA4_9APHY|nr:N/A [Ganoderma boninense]